MSTYRETQKFNALFGYGILAATSGLCYYLAKNHHDFNGLTFALLMVPALIIWGLFEFAKLNTYIDKRGIHYKFFPFVRKTQFIPWEDIHTINVIEYSPLRDYGGYGVRRSKQNGKAYNVKGNQGIMIHKNDGEKLLIGTNSPAEAQSTISLYHT